jgi:hypothetical protein
VVKYEIQKNWASSADYIQQLYKVTSSIFCPMPKSWIKFMDIKQ